MITRFNNILFYADGAKSELSALRRCCTLAGHAGAAVTVLGVVDEVSTNDLQLQPAIRRIQKSMMAERQVQLDQYLAQLGADAEGVKLSSAVVAGKDYLSVIERARDGRFDLIVKASQPSSAMSEVIFGAIDLRLVHHAPCPVLVLKPSRRKIMRDLLLAVDPLAETREESVLNESLLSMGASLAELEDATLHLLHVLEPAPVGKQHQRGDELAGLEQALKDDVTRRLQVLKSPYDASGLVEHLRRGRPHVEIADYVQTHDIDLLIMGSVGRSGIAGIVVGNTAEKILRHVDCSVLVLKPEGWAGK